MSKKTEILVGLGTVVVMVLAFLTYSVVSKSGNGLSFGNTTSTYSTALNQLGTYNLFNDIITSITNTRAPLAGMQTTTTATIVWPAFTSSTLSTTTAIGVPALAGDLVFVSPTTILASSTWTGSVFVASTTGAQITIMGTQSNLATWTPTSTTFYVTVLPRASFLAPAAMSVTSGGAYGSP